MSSDQVELRQLLDTPRWAWIRDFVSAWGLKPFAASTGWSLEDLDRAQIGLQQPLPAVVREWYSIAGRYWPHGFALEAWAQVVLDDYEEELEPDENPFCPYDADEKGVVLLYEHQQACGHVVVRWEDAGQDDPPVYEAGGVHVADSVSDFLRTVFLNHVLEVDGGDPKGLGIRGLVKSQAGTGLAKVRYKELPLKAWIPGEFTFASMSEASYLSGKDILIRCESPSWLWVAARTQEAWDEFHENVREADADFSCQTWAPKDTETRQLNEGGEQLLESYWEAFWESR